MTNEIQDALLTIHRNQQQIDLLTANNTQLINYLLRMGMQPLTITHAQEPRTFLAQGVPDQTQTPKRGRPRKVQVALQIAAPAKHEKPSKANLPQWTPEARAKRVASYSATLAARKRKDGSIYTPAQRAAIGERSRQMWAKRRKEAAKATGNGWGGKRVKGQKAQ